jgi:hypothetical protein
MALNHNIIPQTSLVFGVRDFLPQIEANAKQDREGLQNAFKFGTRVYDFLQGRKQADMIEQFGDTRQANMDLDNDDMARLAELKRELAELKGGV